MKAVVIERPGQIEVREVPDPVPGPGQVLVRVDSCGICGTDLHIAAGEFPPTPYPIVPGHEFAGRVVANGAGTKLTQGTMLAVDPSLFCGRCRFCRMGRGNLCESWGAIGDTVDGAFAELVAVPEANAYVLPEHLSGQQGAMIEPLSCAVHAMDRLGDVRGQRTVLVGAGTMGLLLLQLLVNAGAGPVTVVDRADERLSVAEALGAGDTAANTDELDDASVDLAVDATGAPAAIQSLVRLIDRGGRLLVFGVAPADAVLEMSPFRIYNDEITVVGSMAVLHSFFPAVELMASGAVDVAPLLSEPLPLDEFPRALERVRAGQGIKTHVRP